MASSIGIKPDEAGLSLLIPIISVIGVIGNATVIVVYLKKMVGSNSAGGGVGRGGSLTNIFIVTLAVNDLAACVIVMPLTLILELAPDLVFTNSPICQFYYLITASVIPFSAFLMTAISIDRYLCICHPLKTILTPCRARIVIVVLATFATFMGTLVAFQQTATTESPQETKIADYQFNATLLNTSYVEYQFNMSYYTANYSAYYDINGPAEDRGGCKSSPIFGKTFLEAHHYVHNTITFVVSLALTFTFYALIYSRIWSRHLQKMKRQRAVSKALLNARQTVDEVDANKSPDQEVTPAEIEITVNVTTMNANDDDPDQNPETYEMVEKETTQEQEQSTKSEAAKPSALPRQQSSNAANNKAFKLSSELGTQIRLAAMLFVVTVVFTLSYVPNFLANYTLLFGDPDHNPWNRFVFYIYFVQNAANPIIYGVMNRNFRDDLRQLCCGQHPPQRFGATRTSARQ